MSSIGNLVGYFTDATEHQPTFDPGLDVQCLVCTQPLARPMCTISLLPMEGPRSLFFRAHKDCWDGLTANEQALYEGAVLGSEEK